LHSLFIRRKTERITANISFLASGRTGETHSQIHIPHRTTKPRYGCPHHRCHTPGTLSSPASRTLTAGRVRTTSVAPLFIALSGDDSRFFSLLPSRASRSLDRRAELRGTHFTFADQRSDGCPFLNSMPAGKVTAPSFGSTFANPGDQCLIAYGDQSSIMQSC
jgi:hypothetical protein